MSSRILTFLLVLVFAPLIAFVGGGMEIFLFIPFAIFLAGILAHGLFGTSNQNKNTFLFVILTLLSFRVIIPAVPFDDLPELWIGNVLQILNNLVGAGFYHGTGVQYLFYHYVQQDFYNIFWKSLLALLLTFIVVVLAWGSKKTQDGKTILIFQHIKTTNYILGLFLLVYLAGILLTLPAYIHQKAVKEACASVHFYENQKYVVMYKYLYGETDFLVKFKTTPNQHFECEYFVEKTDIEIKKDGNWSFFGIENNFLILSNRSNIFLPEVVVYDIAKREDVYTDKYFPPLTVHDNTISYWTKTAEKATEQNCANIEKSEVSKASIDTHIILDLLSLTKKDLGEHRCSRGR